MDVNKMNLSLNGCGYLGIYHVGVCACIRKYHPQVLKQKISGGSVGALVACAFMCEVPLSICVKYVFDVSMKVRNGILGPMSPDLNIMNLLRDRMDLMLPPDAHLHCDGRLNVSVTRFDNGQNVLLNRFSSRDELLQALMCSCFIPVYCGYQPPEFHGVAYVDAAMSDNSPSLDRHTVTVAPFSGESNICPKNDSLLTPTSFTLSNTSIEFTTKNMYMLFRVLFPGSPEIQKDFCQQGYTDALRFLRDNDLVPCPRCVSDFKNGHSNCGDIEESLPEEITEEFENSFREFRKRLAYRIFQYKSLRYLYYMNMPSIVTAKVTYLAFSALFQKLQNKTRFSAEDLWTNFLQVLKDKLYGPKKRSKYVRNNEKTARALEANDTDSENDASSSEKCELVVYSDAVAACKE